MVGKFWMCFKYYWALDKQFQHRTVWKRERKLQWNALRAPLNASSGYTPAGLEEVRPSSEGHCPQTPSFQEVSLSGQPDCAEATSIICLKSPHVTLWSCLFNILERQSSFTGASDLSWSAFGYQVQGELFTRQRQEVVKELDQTHFPTLPEHGGRNKTINASWTPCAWLCYKWTMDNEIFPYKRGEVFLAELPAFHTIFHFSEAREGPGLHTQAAYEAQAPCTPWLLTV